jgi:hypothetical protein
MATPTNRTELKDYCLRKLGFPVIDINVDDDQLEDRIDDALQQFANHHFDGTEDTYLAYRVTQADINNQYVTLADSIIGVSRVLPFNGGTVSSSTAQGFNIFDINYQLRLNDFYNLTASSYTYYVIAREHLAMLDMIVTGETPYTFNRKTHQLHLWQDWEAKMDAGDYICFQCRRIVDGEAYSDVFNDTWLKEYTTQLFKRQWGENMKKYGNYVLPGGLIINAQTIYDEAVIEIGRLEEKLRSTYEEPPFAITSF